MLDIAFKKRMFFRKKIVKISICHYQLTIIFCLNFFWPLTLKAWVKMKHQYIDGLSINLQWVILTGFILIFFLISSCIFPSSKDFMSVVTTSSQNIFLKNLRIQNLSFNSIFSFCPTILLTFLISFLLYWDYSIRRFMCVE